MGRAAWYTITDWLIPEFESFRAHPYWDYRQYSWGYGTRAPGATGTITREKALQEMRAYLTADYNTLSRLITRSLNANQWAALLSFSYNLGVDDAKNLVPNINAGRETALGEQWNKYIYAGGVKNSELIRRRGIEWNIWKGRIDS